MSKRLCKALDITLVVAGVSLIVAGRWPLSMSEALVFSGAALIYAGLR